MLTEAVFFPRGLYGEIFQFKFPILLLALLSNVFKRRSYCILLIQICLSHVRAVSGSPHDLGCEKDQEFSFLVDSRPLSRPTRHNGLGTR